MEISKKILLILTRYILIVFLVIITDYCLSGWFIQLSWKNRGARQTVSVIGGRTP
jgi:hypothetical protein